MRIAGFDWDEANWPKCGRHGLSKAEVEAVVSGEPLVLPDRSPQDAETRFNAVGRTAEGRYAFVVYTLRTRGGEALVRPISARYMHRKEIEHYERQKAAAAIPEVRD